MSCCLSENLLCWLLPCILWEIPRKLSELISSDSSMFFVGDSVFFVKIFRYLVGHYLLFGASGHYFGDSAYSVKNFHRRSVFSRRLRYSCQISLMLFLLYMFRAFRCKVTLPRQCFLLCSVLFLCFSEISRINQRFLYFFGDSAFLCWSPRVFHRRIRVFSQILHCLIGDSPNIFRAHCVGHLVCFVKRLSCFVEYLLAFGISVCFVGDSAYSVGKSYVFC